MKNLKIIGFAAVAVAMLMTAGCKNDVESPHEHTFAKEWSSDGTHHWHAATCGDTDEVRDKEEHKPGEWQTETAATEESEGMEKNNCTVCGYELKRSIPKLNHTHTFAAEWTSDGEYHWHAASCGIEAHAEKVEHDWNDGVVTTPPTTSSDGVRTLTCTVCEKTKKQSIHKLGGNKYINDVECQKTEELEICTKYVVIAMTDDSSWSGYEAVECADNCYKGVYIKDRSVILDPFAMGKYEVTQELFEAVMGTNPSFFNGSSGMEAAGNEKQNLRPVEQVNWYDAIAFCNKLSILEGLEPCYSVKIDGTEIDWANLEYSSIPSTYTDPNLTNWNAATCNFKKNGYRLPTEAEWEFAARGGNPNAVEWKYAFSGVNVAQGNMVHTGSISSGRCKFGKLCMVL